MISRRGFIGAIATSAAGLFLAQHVPALLPKSVREKVAGRFLTDFWNEFMRGKSSKEMPRHMTASAELFDAFEGELVTLQRESSGLTGCFYGDEDPRTLMFKCTVLHRGPSCPGLWWANIPLAAYQVYGGAYAVRVL